MQLKIYMFFLQFIIIYEQTTFVITKALIGQNVRQSREGDYNFVVSIKHVLPNTPIAEIHHECSGTLITRIDVLTAAHCLTDKLLDQIQIIVGAVDLRFGRLYYPKWWLLYNEWATQMRIIIFFPTNDIAIIRLTENVPEDIRPPQIWNMTNDELANKRATTAGWSYMENGQLNTAMQTAMLRILSKSDCDYILSSITGRNVNSDVRILCSTINPTVILQPGDNGGPLIYENQIIAVNIGTCPNNINNLKVNLHSGIEFYRAFIMYVLQEF